MSDQNKNNKTQTIAPDVLEEILELYSGSQWTAPQVESTLVDVSDDAETLHDSSDTTAPKNQQTEVEIRSFQYLPPVDPEADTELPPVDVEADTELPATDGELLAITADGVSSQAKPLRPYSLNERNIPTLPIAPLQPPVGSTMSMGSTSSNVMVFFTESDYDKEANFDRLHRTLEVVTSSDVFRHANWPAEKHAFLARLQVCIETAQQDYSSTIYMGDSDAYDLDTILWDSGAVRLVELSKPAGSVSVKIDPATYLVAFVARQFPLEAEIEGPAEVGPDFPIDALPLDYFRFDGALQLGVGHKMTSLAEEALRIKVLSVRDGTGLGGFRLPPRYRIDGLILQGSPTHPVYLSQIFANREDLPDDDKVGRQIDHIHLGRDVDLGEGSFPIPPMSINVLSVQYPHDLDKFSELLEHWEGHIDNLVLWGYKGTAQTPQIHDQYPLFMAMATSQSLSVKRISWIESKVGSQTFEWIQFSDIDCQIFGQNFEHLSVETVSPEQLMMVLRGFGQSLSPKQIEDYIKAFRSDLSDVPVMVKRLFFGTYNISPEELAAETERIQSEQQALWSRLEKPQPTIDDDPLASTQDTPEERTRSITQTDEHYTWTKE